MNLICTIAYLNIINIMQVRKGWYHEKENFYYYCDNCNKLICEAHAPPPICRVCGCGEKLKGGIIEKCSICKIEGGIGWYCNLCLNGIEICENCLEKYNEIYYGPI